MSKSWKSNKKLSLLVAGALGFSIALGVTPSQAFAMTVTQTGDTYYVDGKATSYNDMLTAVEKEVAKDGTTVTVKGSGAASAFSGETLALGKGSSLSVDGATNSANIVGSSSTSNQVKVDGTAVSSAGSDVNLKSLTMSSVGKTAKLGVTGTIENLKLTGGNVVKTSKGTLNTTNLDVADTKLTVNSGTLNATDTTVSGTTSVEGSGTVATKNLNVESAVTVATLSKIKADNVSVANDAAATAVADAIKKGQLKSNSNATPKVSADSSKVSADAVKALEDAGAEVATSVELSGAVTVKDVQDALDANDKVTLTLDQQTVDPLKNKDITVPKGKEIIVTDGTNSIDAVAKETSKVQIADGATLKNASDNSKVQLSSLTITAPGKTIVNKLTGATIDTLKMEKGAVKTTDVTATNLYLGSGTTITGIDGATPTVTTSTVYVDPTSKNDLSGIKLAAASGSEVEFKDLNGNTLTEDQLKAIASNAKLAEGTAMKSGSNTYTVPSSSTDPDATEKATATAAKTTLTDSITNMDKIDPFSSKLPTLDDIENFNSKIEDGNTKTNSALGVTVDTDTLKAELVKKYQTSESTKSLASTSLAAARATTAMTSLFADAVADRTSDLRAGTPASALAGEDGSDTVWVAVKGTRADVDNNSYAESTVKVVTYQAGYDFQVGPNDYLGLFLGSATGSVDPNTKYGSKVDIEHAFNGGLYGTHAFANNQYIDYMLEGGKFDNKANGSTWGTSNFGGSLGYGIKIAQNDNLTINPYIRFKYDRISTDSYTVGGNVMKSDDTNAFSGKIGVNLLTNYGLYGGLAYSRGFSGSYDAYINGIAMPSDDFDSNVIYLNLGYRGTLNDNTLYNVNLEKTFVDYDGWSALGRLDFKF